jgi:hypothetical protein
MSGVIFTVMPRALLTLCALTLMMLLSASCSRQTDFGDPIDDEQTISSVSQAREIPNRGRTLIVRGIIKEVCQDEGCWFALVDERSEIITRFTNNGIGIPVISQGTVLVKGVVRDTVIGNTHVPELHARGVKFVTSQP